MQRVSNRGWGVCDFGLRRSAGILLPLGVRRAVIVHCNISSGLFDDGHLVLQVLQAHLGKHRLASSRTARGYDARMSERAPKRPTRLDPRVEAVLEGLAQRHLGQRLSIGGAIGLSHYLDYRETHDVDAWWSEDTSSTQRDDVIRCIEEVLRPFGKVRTRRWGEVVSIELSDSTDGFSAQIAERTARLAPPASAGWIEVALDTLPDLVASKMVALVERGAPRDLRDIHACCNAGLASADDCWTWWSQRERLSNRDADRRRARLAIETHLARIAQHRPLDSIEEPESRAQADAVRRWYTEVFLA